MLFILKIFEYFKTFNLLIISILENWRTRQNERYLLDNISLTDKLFIYLFCYLFIN